jgi:putative copper export protein
MELSGWEVAAVGIKTILYAATLCAAGGVFFLFYSTALLSPEQHRRIRRGVMLCVAVALAACIVRVFALAGSMGEGIDGVMVRMVLEAGEARATGIRVVGLLILGVVLLSATPRLALASGGGVLAAISFAWIGHAWAVHSAGALPVALLSLHLLGAAFWLGALVPLLVIARDGDWPRLAITASRFGTIAVVVVAVLVVAGSILLWILLGALSDLWTSPYGRAILLKLAFVASLLSLAAFNKLRLTPRIERHDMLAALALKRSIQIEMLLGILILLITAALTTFGSPSS